MLTTELRQRLNKKEAITLKTCVYVESVERHANGFRLLLIKGEEREVMIPIIEPAPLPDPNSWAIICEMALVTPTPTFGCSLAVLDKQIQWYLYTEPTNQDLLRHNTESLQITTIFSAPFPLSWKDVKATMSGNRWVLWVQKPTGLVEIKALINEPHRGIDEVPIGWIFPSEMMGMLIKRLDITDPVDMAESV